MFEPVIDHTTIGDKLVEIWKFAELRTLQPGDLLCRQQTHDRTLYVVQEGILTSFADLPDGTTHRLQKMSRGTFINDECLFVDLPVAYNVRVRFNCCVIDLSSCHWRVIGPRGVSLIPIVASIGCLREYCLVHRHILLLLPYDRLAHCNLIGRSRRLKSCRMFGPFLKKASNACKSKSRGWCVFWLL